MKKMALAAAVAAVFFGFSAGASAAGGPATILRLGSSGQSGVSVKTEHGVKVFRGAPVKRQEPAGGPASAPAAKTVVIRKEVIVEHHYHSRIRHLRTQGFFSGHPLKSRRFTQGFFSGPVDKGRR